MKDIEAKVAEVLTRSEVALNVGSDRGVEKGNTVVLYEVRQIKDPDTKEVLGSVRIRKLSLRITSAEKKMSTAVVTSSQETNAENMVSAALVRARHVITTDPTEARAGRIIYVRPGDKATVSISEPGDNDDPPF
jgi:hypothetical protein